MTTDTSNFNFQGIGIVGAVSIPGCMDPLATNYDPTVTDDDGSCVYPIYGCMDSLACNYDALANVNAISASNSNDPCEYCSCGTPIAGCTNPTACNYNPFAQCDDGSCELPDGCTDPIATNYNASALCNDGSCTYFIQVDGCTDPLANNYDPSANTDDGSCTYNLGCTDPTACNYDAAAVTDDGSCILPDGCTDPLYLEYDPLALCDDSSCATLIVSGCMYGGGLVGDTAWWAASAYSADTIPTVAACNYVQAAHVDDGSCNYTFGCMDPLACNYDSLANCNDGSCNLPDGCTDPLAANYDINALCDDGSCCYVSGCTDPIATNYNPLACFDDGSCTYPCPAIGDFAHGGIVFWVSDPADVNCTGLVCAVTDQAGWVNQTNGLNTYAEWGCLGTDVPGAQGIALGTGYQNTLDIVAANCSSEGGGPTAVDLCVNYTGGGYTDWFLPSIGELFEMYNQLHGPHNAFGYTYSPMYGMPANPAALGGSTGDHSYWASTESHTNPADAAGFANYGAYHTSAELECYSANGQALPYGTCNTGYPVLPVSSQVTGANKQHGMYTIGVDGLFVRAVRAF